MFMNYTDLQYQLLLSQKVGDGCFITQVKEKDGKENYYFSSNSINLDYINFKKSVFDSIDGMHTHNIREGKSGYNSTSKIYSFDTRNHALISLVGRKKTLEVLDELNKIGLIIFYLDDGTYHQKKHFGHIYCNTFSDEEVDRLIKKVYYFYPQKLCKKRYDRKKDGRFYPYIYIPVCVMDEFKKDIERFLVENKIDSMLYKVGK